MINFTASFSGKNRTTPAREAICQFFDSSHEPTDFNQISEHLLSRGLEVNKTTVYRQLDFLLAEKLIEAIDLGEGKKRYEKKRDHHHHLVCTTCHQIECVGFSEDLSRQEAEITQTTRFKITGHTLDFFGICRKCQIKLK